MTMTTPTASPQREREGAESLRDALAAADRALARIGPILGHLLSAPDQSLFSEEILARVRGMFRDLAWQMLLAQAEAAGQTGRGGFAERHGQALAEHFQASPGLLAHVHALALEWQLASRLEAEIGLDPVLSPLVQELIAHDDPQLASTAMASLAAQARFAQTQRRMELPLAELPADLFHVALTAWRGWNGPGGSDALLRAEAKLRERHDESAGRLALLARLAAGLAADDLRPLAIDEAGTALFLTVLAARSGQARERAVMATNARQIPRLSLALRAAGCSQEIIDGAILRLHPDLAPPASAAQISPAQARGLLAQLPGGENS